jgi:hypothetical protein
MVMWLHSDYLNHHCHSAAFNQVSFSLAHRQVKRRKYWELGAAVKRYLY